MDRRRSLLGYYRSDVVGRRSQDGPLSLEQQLESELDLPGVVRSGQLRHGAEVGVAKSSIGIAKHRMIRQIEYFRPKLQIEHLGEAEGLEDGHIDHALPGPIVEIARCIAEHGATGCR